MLGMARLRERPALRLADVGKQSRDILAAAIELAKFPAEFDCSMFCFATDGRDGPTDAAGAYADGGTLARARSRGLDADAALARNDAYGFFDAEGGLFRTGPTRTNVNDFRAIYVDKR